MKACIVKNTIFKVVVVVLFSIVLVDCGGKNKKAENASGPVDERQQEVSVNSEVSAARQGGVDDGWIRTFNDPNLGALVAKALTAYPGHTISATKIEESNALIAQAEHDLEESIIVSCEGYGETINLSTEKQHFEDSQVAWESSVWHRVRTGVAGSTATAEATAIDYRFARFSIVAVVAKAWFVAMAAEQQSVYAKELLALQQQAMEVADAMRIVGQGSEQDFRKASTNVASAQKTLQLVQSAGKTSLKSIELLLGHPLSTVVGLQSWKAVIPTLPGSLESSMVERRPDVVTAGFKVAEAYQQQNEIKVISLPRFRFESDVKSKPLDTIIASLDANPLSVLIVQGGSGKTVGGGASVEQKEAINAYTRVLMKAFEEVRVLLLADADFLRQEAFWLKESKTNIDAYMLNKLAYEKREVSTLTMLAKQQKLLQSEIASLAVKRRHFLSRVDLYLALGGSLGQ